MPQPQNKIWEQRGSGDETLGKVQVAPAVSEADIDYLCNHIYPFIQMINGKMSFEKEFTLTLRRLNWVINDFEEAISASAPSRDRANIVSQAEIAKEIIKLVMSKNWPSIEIIAGTPTLQRMIWIEAGRAKLEVTGYAPTSKDEEVYKRLFEYFKAKGEAWEYPHPVNPKNTAKSAS